MAYEVGDLCKVCNNGHIISSVSNLYCDSCRVVVGDNTAMYENEAFDLVSTSISGMSKSSGPAKTGKKSKVASDIKIPSSTGFLDSYVALINSQFIALESIFEGQFVSHIYLELQKAHLKIIANTGYGSFMTNERKSSVPLSDLVDTAAVFNEKIDLHKAIRYAKHLRSISTSTAASFVILAVQSHLVSFPKSTVWEILPKDFPWTVDHPLLKDRPHQKMVNEILCSVNIYLDFRSLLDSYKFTLKIRKPKILNRLYAPLNKLLPVYLQLSNSKNLVDGDALSLLLEDINLLKCYMQKSLNLLADEYTKTDSMKFLGDYYTRKDSFQSPLPEKQSALEDLIKQKDIFACRPRSTEKKKVSVKYFDAGCRTLRFDGQEYSIKRRIGLCSSSHETDPGALVSNVLLQKDDSVDTTESLPIVCSTSSIVECENIINT